MNKVPGYLTVEAALIFPVILMIYFYIFQLALIQYDRCIIEQEVNRVIVNNGNISNCKIQNSTLIANNVHIKREDKLGRIKYSAIANISRINFTYEYQYIEMDPIKLLRLERKLKKNE